MIRFSNSAQANSGAIDILVESHAVGIHPARRFARCGPRHVEMAVAPMSRSAVACIANDVRDICPWADVAILCPHSGHTGKHDALQS